jgi:hypothetical protein
MAGEIPSKGGGAEKTQQVILKMKNLDKEIHK